jgi:tetratricopeptide (TPR) repeat protein
MLSSHPMLNVMVSGAAARMAHVRRFGSRTGIAAVVALLAIASPAAADSIKDCFSDDNNRRIEGCSALIAIPGLDAGARSLAHAMRALAYSLQGMFEKALPDHDQAVTLDPASAMALNNRAWTLFKLHEPRRALDDVERSIALAPMSPHAHDTRAHIRQSMGDPASALADYERAMQLGGERIVRLYQCGLQAQGMYVGSTDGAYSSDMRRAFRACVRNRNCEPLPPDEDCRFTTS